MEKNEAKERIDYLIKIINKSSYEYYVLDNPMITDQEYDDFYNELLTLEEKYPDLKRDDSPTNRVGGEVLDKFQKVMHTKPLLSFDDIFNEEEIKAFDERIRKVVPNPSYTVEPKMDGLKGCLIYEKGILIRAATRGDGVIGEDITQNAKTIKSIPLRLNEDIDIEVHGEIYMSKSSFEKVNKEREENGEAPFANPRNAAAGSVRQLDSKVAAKRNLDFIAYFLPNPEDYGIKEQTESLAFLKKLGFVTNDKLNTIASTIEEIIERISYLNEQRPNLPYAIDGVVLKVNSLEDEEKLGSTTRVPRWGIAYKFPAEEVLTTLKEIKFTVGRTGRITPNAIFNPVHVDGSLVSKATLHNEDYVIMKGLKIGDVISIRKAGDVIPEVVEAKKERRTGEETEFVMITNCPICNSLLIKKEGQIDHYCPNVLCPARKVEGLIHYCSRKAMNIDGLGDEIIEDLYNMGFVKTIPDIYSLKEYKQDLIELEGYGNKSVDNLIDAIEVSKSNSLERVLFGLGISGIGDKTALILAKKFKNLDNMINASFDDYINIPDIGPTLAQNLCDFFKNEEKIEIINRLKEIGVNMNFLGGEGKYDYRISGKKFVLTGTLEFMGRDELSRILEDYGAVASGSVSKKTDVVIVGENPGSKLDKAKELGIEIWNEEKIKEIIESL